MLYDINGLSLDVITLPSAAEERNRQCLDGARLCCQTKTEIYLPKRTVDRVLHGESKIGPLRHSGKISSKRTDVGNF